MAHTMAFPRNGIIHIANNRRKRGKTLSWEAARNPALLKDPTRRSGYPQERIEVETTSSDAPRPDKRLLMRAWNSHGRAR